MLDCTPELASLLEAWRTDTSVAPYVAELYTFTGASGAVIARWTGADASLTYSGNTYAKGPGITRGQITRQIGTQASSLDVTFSMDASVTLNGVPLAAFIAGNGLINAVMTFERAYAPAPGQPIVGTLPKFTGRVMQMKDTGETQATIVVSNWMDLLNVQVPVNVWQPPCLHVVFDAGCKLNRADFEVSGIVQGGSDGLTVNASLAAVGAKAVTTDAYLDLGKIVFTSGANNALSRTVKTQGGGVIALVRALPAVPQPGDTFVGYPGCDLAQATCLSKFDNLAHFKGYPFIPTNETAAP
jgi:uncharacterized phage protein (TIGR02218 family)